MPGHDTSRLLDEAWRHSLFDALYGRRSRRFGLGFEIAEGPFRYKSKHPPLPLTEIEEALLVGAGAGFSGLALWDLPTPPAYRAHSGRTFPTTTPGGHTRCSSPTIRACTCSMDACRQASSARSRPRTSARKSSPP